MKYTPKDKLADWFRFYADAMELNFWGKTTLEGEAEYDEKTQKWAVTVLREGYPPRKMHVNHLVLATGFSGRPRIPNFKGAENFKGPIIHAAYHKGGEGWEGKKAIVCGTGNTGHDVRCLLLFSLDSASRPVTSTYTVDVPHRLQKTSGSTVPM